MLWQRHYGRYIMADILQLIYYGIYITVDALWQIYYSNYISAYIFMQIIMADILRLIYFTIARCCANSCHSPHLQLSPHQQLLLPTLCCCTSSCHSPHLQSTPNQQPLAHSIHYGRYYAYHKNGHVLTHVQLQKLPIVASEPVCCNALPQRDHRPPRQP